VRFRIIFPALLSLLALSACATHSTDAASGVAFVVVRHAEKATDDPRDPSLTASGQARAAALAERFATAPLEAAYATAYKRTQQTALPAATASGIGVTTYDAARPAADFAAELQGTYKRGTVLVVGHSNTVPDIVAALCACAVAPLDESTYDRLYEVRIDADGRAVLTQRSY